MSRAGVMQAIVRRDLARAVRQKSRLLGGLARPFMWLLLVGSGYNAIARVEGIASYRAFVFPGLVVMAALFGAMLTAISTVYDREFGMLRLMLASPAGAGTVLVSRAVAATVVGALQGAVILLCMPLVVAVSVTQMLAAGAALLLAAAMSSVLGLLVAAPLRSVENFAGVINVVLFPLLFLSGALYPTTGMPLVLRTLARVNPVSYGVDLVRTTLGQPAEFPVARSIVVLSGTIVMALTIAVWLFDPERRSVPRVQRGAGRSAAETG
jgi:ABC-2 type transport system permease protein